MSEHTGGSYTTEEIARLLRISKLTVYDLIKKGELAAYRVGRQMRVDENDLEAYKAKAKSRGAREAVRVSSPPSPTTVHAVETAGSTHRNIVITGQDVSLDLLGKHLERRLPSIRALRAYTGSMDSLIALYRGQADIVSTHLLDGDTGEYNVPYVRKLLVGHAYTVIRLLSRKAGLFVPKGNPKAVSSWNDLGRPDIRIVNREKGSGARVLLDEQLRLGGVSPERLQGYDREETSHLGVAGTVASGAADAGVGTENAAALVNVDFIPLAKERYDLVLLKSEQNRPLIATLLSLLRDASFLNELGKLHGYDLSETGRIVFETGGRGQR